MKVSGPDSGAGLVPPDGATGAEPAGATEGQPSDASGAQPTEGAERAFAETLAATPTGGPAATSPFATSPFATSPSGPAPGAHATGAIAAELDAGRLTPAAAVERVLEQVLARQLGNEAPAAVRERVRAALQEALESDPLLADKLRRLET